MAFPTDLTNAVDTTTEIVAAHLNAMETKVGIDSSAVVTSIDYLLKNAASADPGHKHGIGVSINGLAANVATFLATPSSANLLAAVTDETGSGVLVFSTSPTFTTSVILPTTYLGDTSNANVTLGLTINQGANDDQIFSLKSSDVAHTVTTDTEADTFGYMSKYSATLGGLLIRGITDADAAGGLVVEGIIGSTDPTDTNAALILIGSKQTGTTTAALGAAETVFQLKNRTTDLVTVLGNGNTGIGTTGPGGPLDIQYAGNKQVLISGFSTTAVEPGILYIRHSNSDTTGTLTTTVSTNRLGQINFMGVSSSASWGNGAVIRATQNGSAGAIYIPTDLFLMTSDGVSNATERVTILSTGNVGIGDPTPSYQLELSTDSAAKPSTNTWTVPSDERLKENIQLANLQECYDKVKSLPLKTFRWKEDSYSDKQIKSRDKLGWIAQDVQPLFPASVNVADFKKAEVEVEEEIEEQEFEEREVTKTETVIEMIDGKAIQKIVEKVETVKIPLFDIIPVFTETGEPVIKDGKSLTHQVPRMKKVIKPKLKREIVKYILNLNTDEIYASMFGAIQLMMDKIEQLEADNKALKEKIR